MKCRHLPRARKTYCHHIFVWVTMVQEFVPNGRVVFYHRQKVSLSTYPCAVKRYGSLLNARKSHHLYLGKVRNDRPLKSHPDAQCPKLK